MWLSESIYFIATAEASFPGSFFSSKNILQRVIENQI